MDVLTIRVRVDRESVAPFCETAGEFVTDPIGFLRRDLAGFERLPRVISDDVPLALSAAREGIVLLFRQKELGLDRFGCAIICGDEFAALRFERVLHVVHHVAERSCYTAVAGMDRDYSGRRYGITFSREKRRPHCKRRMESLAFWVINIFCFFRVLGRRMLALPLPVSFYCLSY